MFAVVRCFIVLFAVLLIGSCGGGSSAVIDDDCDEVPDVDNGELPSIHWVVGGAAGSFMVSENGTEWQSIVSDKQEQINAVRCEAENRCVSVGNDGGIYYSTSAGLQWSAVESEVQLPLYAISANASEWLIGGRKETLLSFDGQKTTPHRILVVNGSSRIGSVWHIIRCKKKWFVRGDRALYYADTPEDTWTRWDVDEHTHPAGDTLCLTSDMIIGLNLVSKDGFRWRVRSDKELPSWFDTFTQTAAASDGERAFVAGFIAQQEGAVDRVVIVWIDDGTTTWHEATLPKGFKHLISSLATDGNGTWSAVTQQGDIIMSNDNGQTWNPVFSDKTRSFFSVSFNR